MDSPTKTAPVSVANGRETMPESPRVLAETPRERALPASIDFCRRDGVVGCPGGAVSLRVPRLVGPHPEPGGASMMLPGPRNHALQPRRGGRWLVDRRARSARARPGTRRLPYGDAHAITRRPRGAGPIAGLGARCKARGCPLRRRRRRRGNPPVCGFLHATSCCSIPLCKALQPIIAARARDPESRPRPRSAHDQEAGADQPGNKCCFALERLLVLEGCDEYRTLPRGAVGWLEG